MTLVSMKSTPVLHRTTWYSSRRVYTRTNTLCRIINNYKWIVNHRNLTSSACMQAYLADQESYRLMLQETQNVKPRRNKLPSSSSVHISSASLLHIWESDQSSSELFFASCYQWSSLCAPCQRRPLMCDWRWY